MTGSRSRNKGKAGERELAHFLSERGISASRGAQHSGSPESPDVRIDLPGFHIECKRAETFQPYKALEQARSDAGDKVPLVFHRRNRHGWIVVMDGEDAVEMMKDAAR